MTWGEAGGGWVLQIRLNINDVTCEKFLKINKHSLTLNNPITHLQEHVNPDVTFPLIYLHIRLFVTWMLLSIWLFKSFIAGNYLYPGM